MEHGHTRGDGILQKTNKGVPLVPQIRAILHKLTQGRLDLSFGFTSRASSAKHASEQFLDSLKLKLAYYIVLEQFFHTSSAKESIFRPETV